MLQEFLPRLAYVWTSVSSHYCWNWSISSPVHKSSINMTKWLQHRMVNHILSNNVLKYNFFTHNHFTAGLEYVRVHPGQQVPER